MIINKSCEYRLIQLLMVGMLVLAILMTIPFMIYAGKPNDLDLDFFTFAFIGLQSFPYILLLFINHFLNTKPQHTMILFVVSILSVGFAVGMFYYGFFLDAEAQNGLYLVIVPMTQIAISIATGLGFIIARKKAR